MSNQVTKLAAVVIAVVASGCSLSPDYTRPDVSEAIPDAFPASALTGTSASDVGWREYFRDPELQRLIELALLNNSELTLASLETLAMRARYNIERADRLPNATLDVSGTRSRVPQSVSATGSEYINQQHQVGVGLAAFELDFFGRVKSLSETALANYLATEEAERSVQITLIAELAGAYVGERSLAKRLVLAEQALEGREAAMKLAVQRYEAGVSSELDVRQQETLLESARVSVARLRREHAQARNAINVLVGQPVELSDSASLDGLLMSPKLPADLPSELLTQRPDIRAAEQRLIGANASIGAARAAFFPSISLTASVGSASDELSGLFESGTGAWSFMPRISLPIFDGGRNEANLELAHLRRNAAVAEYEQAVQVAFREVADALVARETLDEQLAAQQRLYDAQAQRLALARQRYEQGVAGHLEALDAERELFDAEQALVQVRALQITNRIDLYRALGGGVEVQRTVASN